MHEYDLIAEWYAAERSRETGVAEVRALANALPPDSLVLDIGCGNGIPITRTLLESGQCVVGLDSSSAMLQKFQANCPGTRAVLGDIQTCEFAASSFDGAVAWGVMFHFRPDDQVKAIARVADVLKTGAPFLFTSGDTDGFEPKEGTMDGVVFRYYSFSTENYRRILREQGFALVDVHVDSGENTYYLATKC